MRMTAKGRRNDGGGGSNGINYTSCSSESLLVSVIKTVYVLRKVHSNNVTV